MNGISKVLNIRIIDVSNVKQVVSSANGTEIVVNNQSAWIDLPIGHDPVSVGTDAVNQDAGTLYTCSFEARIPDSAENRETMDRVSKIKNGLAKLGCISGETFLFGSKEYPVELTVRNSIGTSPGSFHGYVVSASGSDVRAPRRV